MCDVCAQVPPALAAVVARCMAKAPGDRFPNVASLHDALACAVADGGWTEREASTWWAARERLA